MKRFFSVLFVAILVMSIWPKTEDVSANTLKATFDSFVYSETEQGGNVTKTLQYIVVRNSAGKTNRYRIDKWTYLYVNNTPTVAESFKYGMPVELVRNNLGKVTKLYGYSTVPGGAIPGNSRQTAGIVTQIDPNGMYIKVKLDYGVEKEFYLNKDTQYFKGSQNVDLSFMYEGDRVILKQSSSNSSALTQVEVIQNGIAIENLYRGKLHSTNAITNRVTIQNVQPFTDWNFGTASNNVLKTFKFDNATSIYYGNTKIRKDQVSKYKNSDMYYVTVNQNGTELVKKMIIMQNYERTYFDEVTLIDKSYKYFRLKESGLFYYHNGSILVRNGRLVEPTSLTTIGSAFVLTDGLTRDNFSHVVNVVNDSFLSPNLATHELYFGQLAVVDNSRYLVEIDNSIKLQNNYWNAADTKQLSFSNNTVATRNQGSLKLAVTSLQTQVNKYGYFYVKDGHIQAVHFLNSDQEQTSEVITGRVTTVNAAGQAIEVRDLSQWRNGSWLEMANVPTISLAQTLIIKNGKTVTVNDIKTSDRVVLLTDKTLNTHILLVNE